MHKIVEFLMDYFELEGSCDWNRPIESIVMWDSYNILELLVSIEDTFGKRITIGQIAAIHTGEDLIKVIYDLVEGHHAVCSE